MFRQRNAAHGPGALLGHRTFAVVLGALCVTVTSAAGAQSTDPMDKSPHHPSSTPGHTQDTSQDPSQTYPSPSSPTQTSPSPSSQSQTYPAQGQTPSTSTYTMPPTSMTQTTGAEYVEGAGAERTTEIRPNRPMLVTGLALFGASYGASVIVGAQSDLDEDKRLFIPVVGPWLDLGQRPCSFGSECSSGDNIASAFLIASGIAQGVGVLMTAASFAVPERKTTTQAAAVHKPSVQVTPVSFRGGAGLGAVGRF